MDFDFFLIDQGFDPYRKKDVPFSRLEQFIFDAYNGITPDAMFFNGTAQVFTSKQQTEQPKTLGPGTIGVYNRNIRNGGRLLVIEAVGPGANLHIIRFDSDHFSPVGNYIGNGKILDVVVRESQTGSVTESLRFRSNNRKAQRIPIMDEAGLARKFWDYVAKACEVDLVPGKAPSRARKAVNPWYSAEFDNQIVLTVGSKENGRYVVISQFPKEVRANNLRYLVDWYKLATPVRLDDQKIKGIEGSGKVLEVEIMRGEGPKVIEYLARLKTHYQEVR